MNEPKAYELSSLGLPTSVYRFIKPQARATVDGYESHAMARSRESLSRQTLIRLAFSFSIDSEKSGSESLIELMFSSNMQERHGIRDEDDENINSDPEL